MRRLLIASCALLALASFAFSQAVTIGPVVFTGAGLNDATVGGTYVGVAANHQYKATIATAGTPDTVTFSRDGGSATVATAITGAAQRLSYLAGSLTGGTSSGGRITYTDIGHGFTTDALATITGASPGGCNISNLPVRVIDSSHFSVAGVGCTWSSGGTVVGNDGVTITWVATTGHTANAAWTAFATAQGSITSTSTIQRGVGAFVAQNSQVKLNDRASCAIDFTGVVGDGSTDSTVGLRNCLNSGHAHLYIGADKNGGLIYKTSSILQPPPNSITKIETAPGVTIMSTGAGCWNLEGFVEAATLQLPACVRASINWDPSGGSTDTTSIGVRVANTVNAHIDLPIIQGFATGLLLCGGTPIGGDQCHVTTGNTGTYHNIITYRLLDNKVGKASQPDAGGVNQNIETGEIRINGAHCPGAGGAANLPVPGTVYQLLLNGSNNMNFFQDGDYENECAVFAISDHGNNSYYNPRLEKPDYTEQGSVDLTGGLVIGPYVGSGTLDMFTTGIARTVNVAGDGLHVTRASGVGFTDPDNSTNFGIGVRFGTITYNVATVVDNDHLTLSGSPFTVIGAPLTSIAMNTILDPNGTLGVLGDGNTFMSTEIGHDCGSITRPCLNLYNSRFPHSQIDVAGDGVSVTLHAGTDFSALPVGLTVYFEGIAAANCIAAKADATHFTFCNAIPSAPRTDFTLDVPEQVFTVSHIGTVSARSVNVSGPVTGSSFNGVQFGAFAPCIGSVAGCARIEDDGPTGTPMQPFSATNSLTGWYGTIFRAQSGAVTLGDVAGDNRIVANGAVSGYPFELYNTGNSLAGLRLAKVKTTSELDVSGATLTGFNFATKSIATATGAASISCTSTAVPAGGGTPTITCTDSGHTHIQN